MNGTLRVTKGDVRSPQMTNDNELAIIPHCCNNLGVMGAGVALALRNKWPLVYKVYEQMEAAAKMALSCPNGFKDRLGYNCNAVVENNIIVVNMVGQDGTVNADNPKPVKYWALSRCLKNVRTNLIATLAVHKSFKAMKPVIHCPKFGSDLAGGDWNFILELIREEWLEHGIDVVVYEFE